LNKKSVDNKRKGVKAGCEEMEEWKKYQFWLDKIGLVGLWGEIFESWQTNKPPHRNRKLVPDRKKEIKTKATTTFESRHPHSFLSTATSPKSL
jgi:hypothetical protein